MGMKIWHCPKCKTENPEQSKFCQTCGNRPERDVVESEGVMSVANGGKRPIKQAKKVDELLGSAAARFVESDFSSIGFYGVFVRTISYLSLMFGFVIFVYTWSEVDFWLGFLYLISFILLSVPGFMTPVFMCYLLELKHETNQAAQASYVSAKMSQEILDTLKSIEKK